MRSKSRLGILVLIAVVAMIATVSEAVLTEKDVNFYAYTYGDGTPAYNSTCFCVVGPCAPIYELVGHYHVDCYGNRTEQWGYTNWNGQCGAPNHPTDRIVTVVGSCPN